VYAFVAAAGFLENLVPFVPSDALVALAAFLSARGDTTATAIFLWTWIGSVLGAGVVYFLARRFGRAFFESGPGRKLLTPDAVVTVEREYLRFGLAGLFFARLLPGFRSFTAPFAGLVRIGAVRAFIPFALASGAWYGAVIYLSARLGRNWEDVLRLVSTMNRAFGGLAVAVMGVVVAWWLLNRRRRRHERLALEVTGALAPFPGLSERALTDPAVAAVAAVLLETAHADGAFSVEELRVLEQHLRSRLHLPGGVGQAAPGEARAVLERLEPATRAGLAEQVREIAFADEALRRHETQIMARVARLLGLEAPARGRDDRQ
jgi:membrane protein DedA with SNARE-associated domain/uncharacterized tellurite resistance protein B-like protein